MAASFQIEEAGLDHQIADAQGAGDPGRCRARKRLRERALRDHARSGAAPIIERERPIELRAGRIPAAIVAQAASTQPTVWFRAAGQLPDEPRDAPMRARLRVRHDTARHSARAPRPQRVRSRSRPRASTTRCGSTARSAPTSGCSMRRTARSASGARGFTRGLHLSRRTARSVASVGAGRLDPPASAMPRLGCLTACPIGIGCLRTSPRACLPA